MKKTADDWFAEYGESHQNPTNKLIHWICVPLIFFSVVALLNSIKIYYIFELEFIFGIHFVLSMAHIALVLAGIFYWSLSKKLAIGAILFSAVCLGICNIIETNHLPLALIALIVFATAWIGQFYGHHIEGKKPSFLKDLQFLLIGPIWLLGYIYRKINIQY